jgi:TniQ
MPATCDLKLVPRLPLAPRPFRDELLVSWLARVACRYGHEAREFQEWLWCRAYPAQPRPGGQAPADTDESAQTIALWAHVARLDPERLGRLTLVRRYPGRAGHWFLQTGHPAWPSRRRSPAVCPSCLDADAAAGRDAYLRITWMLAERCACPRHHEFLIDQCPRCAMELRPAFRLQATCAILVCGRCGQRLGARQGRGDLTAPIALLLSSQDRIGRGLRESERWRDALESTIALLWAPLDRANAARPVLSLELPDNWRWSIRDRQMVGHLHPLGHLSVAARVITFRLLGERFGADLELDGDAAASWRLRAAAVGQVRRSVRARPLLRPVSDDPDRFQGLAVRLLAHPDWIAAQQQPERRRRAVEARMMDRALTGILWRTSDGAESRPEGRVGPSTG